MALATDPAQPTRSTASCVRSEMQFGISDGLARSVVVCTAQLEEIVTHLNSPEFVITVSDNGEQKQRINDLNIGS